MIFLCINAHISWRRSVPMNNNSTNIGSFICKNKVSVKVFLVTWWTNSNFFFFSIIKPDFAFIKFAIKILSIFVCTFIWFYNFFCKFSLNTSLFILSAGCFCAQCRKGHYILCRFLLLPFKIYMWVCPILILTNSQDISNRRYIKFTAR